MLRFVAAFFVLVEHLLQSFERGYVDSNPLALTIPVLWRSGVDIFFIISGFIMLHVTADKFGQPGSARDFLLRRVIRVVPMYWLFTSLMVGTAIILPDQLNNSAMNITHIAASYFFIPWPRPDGAVQPILGPGWTLNYEMFFYAVFAVALFCRKAVGLALIVTVFLTVALFGQLFGKSLGPFAFWTQLITVEFLFGLGLAAVYQAGVRLHLGARLLLICAGLILGGIAETQDLPFSSRWLWAGIPSLLIAAGAILGAEAPESRIKGWLVVGGAASYALYLSHLFSLKAMGILWRSLGIDSSWAYFFVAGGVAIAAAIAIHRYVEQPMLRVGRMLLMGPPGAGGRSSHRIAREEG